MANTPMLYDSTEAQIVQREILDRNIGKQYEEEGVFVSLFPFGSQRFVHDAGAFWVDDMEPGGGFRGMDSSQRTFAEGSKLGRAKFKITFSELARTIKGAGRVFVLDKQSLTEGWAPLMRSQMSAFIKGLNFEHHADGTGKLGTVSAIDPNNVIITFNAPQGAAMITRREGYNFVDPNAFTKHTFTIGGTAYTYLYAISKSGGYIANFSATESATTADAYTGTTAVVGDLVTLRDHANEAVHGIRYHISNASRTYQNQSTTTWPQLIPPIIPAGGGPLSTRLLDQLEYSLIIRQGQKQTLESMFWITSAAQHAAYRKLGYNAPNQVVKRLGAGDRTLDLGYNTIEHNGRMFLIDVDCDETWLPFIDRATWERYGAKAPSVVPGAGGGYLNAVYASDGSGNLNWEMTVNVNCMTELANRYIAKNGAVDNLQYAGLPLKADVVQH